MFQKCPQHTPYKAIACLSELQYKFSITPFTSLDQSDKDKESIQLW